MYQYQINISIILLLTSSPTFSMNNKSSFFRRACTASASLGTGVLALTHYSLACGPTMGPTILASMNPLPLDNFEEPNAEAQRFIREQLAIQGINNPEAIAIKRLTCEKKDLVSHTPAAFKDCILVPSFIDYKKRCITSRLEKDLLRQKKSSYYKHNKTQKTLNEHTFVYRHEANHIKNKDLKNRKIASIMIPLVTQGVIYFCKKPFALHKRWLTNLASIPSGITKGYVNVLLYKAYARRQEQQADNEVIIDDPQVLKAGIHFFKKFQKKQLKRALSERYVLLNKSTRKIILESLDRKKFLNVNEHPSCATRIEQLNKRLDDYKRKNNNTRKNQ